MGFSWPTSGFTPLVFFGLIPLLLIEDFIIRDNLGSISYMEYNYNMVDY